MNDFTILTSYFTALLDPQHHYRVEPNDPALLKLAPGCRKHGIDLIIFHDELSPDFVEEQSGEHVGFVRCALPDPRSNNIDNRWFHFQEWLCDNPVKGYLFFCDLFDCQVNRSMDCLVPLIEEHDLLISVNEVIDKTTPGGHWMVNKLNWCYDSTKGLDGRKILCAGTWGGKRDVAIGLLDEFCAELTEVGCKTMADDFYDMAPFNVVGYGRERKFWAEGAPLHSPFRAFAHDADVVFVHK